MPAPIQTTLPPEPPWVLLRGLMRDARHWMDFPDHLRAVFPEAKLVPVDLPGNGTQAALTSPTRVPLMTEHARRWLRAAGHPPPYRLLAVSLGGMVAADWAARYPGEIAGLALVNTSFRPLSPFWQRLQPRAWTMIPAMALGRLSPREVETRVLGLTTGMHPEKRLPGLLDRWTQWQSSPGVARRSALNQLLAAARFRLPARPPGVPMLVLNGAADALVGAACSTNLAMAWQAEAATHPTAGHDLTLDDPAWVAQTLGRWWRDRSYSF